MEFLVVDIIFAKQILALKCIWSIRKEFKKSKKQSPQNNDAFFKLFSFISKDSLRESSSGPGGEPNEDRSQINTLMTQILRATQIISRTP